MNTEIKNLLQDVKEGKVSVDDALLSLKEKPYEDIGFAKVDLHRKIRQGMAEVIYGEGKTVNQIVRIMGTMLENGQSRILVTRLNEDASKELSERLPEVYKPVGGNREALIYRYFPDARMGFVGDVPKADGIGRIVVVTGGTSDIPVAEEAALTAELYGNEVIKIFDVGVAGIHRLLAHKEEIMSATVIIAIAGMEGALASVVGGLADCPVIAVPTSVGYGASFDGLSALLSMLNSCASGVSVVNIDNGFGAGYLASMINHVQ